MMLLSFWFGRSHSIPNSKFYSTRKFKTVLKGASLKIRPKHTLDGWIQLSFSILLKSVIYGLCLVCNALARVRAIYDSCRSSGLLASLLSKASSQGLKVGRNTTPSSVSVPSGCGPTSVGRPSLHLCHLWNSSHMSCAGQKRWQVPTDFTLPSSENKSAPQLSIRVSQANGRNNKQRSQNITQDPRHPLLWCAKGVELILVCFSKTEKQKLY